MEVVKMESTIIIVIVILGILEKIVKLVCAKYSSMYIYIYIYIYIKLSIDTADKIYLLKFATICFTVKTGNYTNFVQLKKL